MEDPGKRLKRFQNGPPEEIILTLLNSIHNFFTREIDQAADNKSWYLVVLGIHAVILTISEGLFNKKGLTGFKFFLEKFVDSPEEGFDFSKIADKIHNFRNVIAHQWLSASGYELGIDESMLKGWESREDVIYFNPVLYYEAFKNSFSGMGKVWDYKNIMSDKELEESKTRLIEKYIREK